MIFHTLNAFHVCVWQRYRSIPQTGELTCSLSCLAHASVVRPRCPLVVLAQKEQDTLNSFLIMTSGWISIIIGWFLCWYRHLQVFSTYAIHYTFMIYGFERDTFAWYFGTPILEHAGKLVCFDIFILWLRCLGQHNCLVDWKVGRIGRFLGEQSHSSTYTHIVCALPREPDGDAPGTTANKSTWSETWRVWSKWVNVVFLFVKVIIYSQKLNRMGDP